MSKWKERKTVRTLMHIKDHLNLIEKKRAEEQTDISLIRNMIEQLLKDEMNSRRKDDKGSGGSIRV